MRWFEWFGLICRILRASGPWLKFAPPPHTHTKIVNYKTRTQIDLTRIRIFHTRMKRTLLWGSLQWGKPQWCCFILVKFAPAGGFPIDYFISSCQLRGEYINFIYLFQQRGKLLVDEAAEEKMKNTIKEIEEQSQLINEILNEQKQTWHGCEILHILHIFELKLTWGRIFWVLIRNVKHFDYDIILR